ncbi:hypothetical protein KY290_027028 [Solanum tuberosum]|uniref:Protein kinase domain-containing protein n=1 Tax=Solanum tuberosum TaxID=4113 RepID=A0ABQ7UDS3_SOLTU|nr:hypothetical protein KY290_027028 [Solanum tuberosum]
MQFCLIALCACSSSCMISDGCSKALLVEMVKFGQSIVNLMQDSHPRVRWAKIRTIGQLSTYLSLRFQEEYLWQLLPALIEVLDDFDYPRLQRGLAMMKEAALETLASVAISSQEDSAYIYDSIIPYLKVILETATKDTSRTPLAKSMECITMVTMAFGNQEIHGYVEKVTAVLISLQETQTEIEDPMRKFSLLAYGRLCKCLGEDFLPYLSLATPTVLKSAQLSVSNSSDTDDSDDERYYEDWIPLLHSFLRKVTGVPTRFKLKELEEATDNFGLLVGRGSSACVFKGVLSDGASVAVKRINGEECGNKEFKSEVAAIASVQHVNLVRLYCSVPPSGPRFLVYEYIVNGSLDNWISRKRGIRGCLSLDLRCRVGLDVAKALSYLHHDCRSCILHLDVKPENILLDENHRAILVDFGLSKLMGKVESRVVTMIRGTRGYLAPEWLLENGISEKSDVYSYGMVLLEMIGGRRNITSTENGKSINSKSKFSYLPKIVSEKLEQGKVMEVVDERLVHEAATGGVAIEMQVKRLACVALSCIQERPSLRSTTARVVEMLEGRGPVEAPRQTTMLILDLLDEGVDYHPGIPRVAAAMARSDTNSLRFYTMSILSRR